MAISSSLPASGLEIQVYRGDTFERWVRIRRNGVEEDLASSTYKLQIRSGSALIHEISSSSPPSGSITIDSPYGGVLKLSIPASMMSDLDPGSYVYDVEQTYPAPSNKVKTRFRGTFSITDDITKSAS